MGRPIHPHIITDDSALGGSVIERSLRFNGSDSTAHLSRTPSSTGSRKVWTFSAWIKKTHLDDGPNYIYSANNGNTEYFALYFRYNKLYTYFHPTNNYGEVNSRVFRDGGSWFNVVHQVDAGNTTQRIWINNEELSLNSNRNPSNSNYPVNEASVLMRVGNATWRNDNVDAYLAEVNHIDGQLVFPSSFGYTDFQTGIWRPKRFIATGPNNGTTWSGNVTSSNLYSGSYANVFNGNFYGSDATINSSDASNNHFTLSSVNVVASKVGVVLSNSSSDIQVYVNGSLVGTAAGGNITNNVSKLFEFTFTETTVSTIKVQRGSSTSGWQIYGVSLNGVPLLDGDTNNVGLNGFHLDFSDNSAATATTLGKDKSGNGNNFTPSNISVSAGVGNDSLLDSPSNNFATINALSGYSTDILVPTNGNLDFSLANNRFAICSFIIPTSGKWYAECVWTDVQTGDIGVFNPTRLVDNSQSFDGRWNGIVMKNNGYIRIDNTQVQSGLTSITAGAIIGILIDREAGTVSFTINGTANGTPILLSTMHFQDGGFTIRAGRNSSSGSNPTGSFNFGQRPFSYLPSGYKSLCSKNIPTTASPTIIRPQKHFDTLQYTTGSSNGTFTHTGLEFKPDFMWIKCSSDGEHHYAVDSLRGDQGVTNKFLRPSDQSSEGSTGLNGTTWTTIDGGFKVTETSIDNSNGGGEIYYANRNYVAWSWKAGGSSNTFNVDGKGYATAAAAGITDGTLALTGASINTKNGFSITTYVGTGSAGTVGHGLGKKPTFWLMKNVSSTSDWFAYYTITDGSLDYLKLNTNVSSVNSSASAPTTTTIGATSTLSTSGHTWIVYAWTDVPGYSKVGYYKGNQDANGEYIPLGFRPAFVLLKRTTAAASWVIHDRKRAGFNPDNDYLHPDNNQAQSDGSSGYIDLLSDGFKLRGTSGTHNNGSFIYLAFAEQVGTTPFATQTNAL